jgi:hypothetical protein
MRENILYTHAHMFTGAFYTNLYTRLRPRLPTQAQADARVSITVPEDVWLNAMSPSREALSTNPDDEPAWALPVVYLQRDGLNLKARPLTVDLDISRLADMPDTTSASSAGTPAGISLKAELDGLRTARNMVLAHGAPAYVVQEFDTHIRDLEVKVAKLDLEALQQARKVLQGAGASDQALAALNEQISLISLRLSQPDAQSNTQADTQAGSQASPGDH